MVLNVGYIEYEIVFLPIWLKRNHPKENIHGGTAGEKQEAQWKHFSSTWVLAWQSQPCLRGKLSLLLHLHVFIKKEDAFSPPGALGRLCGSWMVNYSRSGSRTCGWKATWSSSAACIELFNLLASDSNFQQYTSVKEFCWQEGPLMAL